MKLCFITSIYKPYTRGGAEVFVSNLVGELIKQHEVIVITADRYSGIKSLFPRVSIEEGVKVYRFYPLNIFSFLDINEKPLFFRAAWSFFDIFNLHSLWVLASILRREKFDVVMTHALKGITYATPLLLRLLSVPLLHTPHDVQLVIPSGKLQSGQESSLLNPFIQFYSCVTKALFGSPRWVIFSSQFLKNFYCERGFFPSSHSIVLQSPTPLIPVLRVDSQHQGPFTFLFIGQLEEGKGVRELVEAFTGLDVPGIRLVVVGGGSLLDELKDLAKKDTRVEILGYKSGSEKFEVIRGSNYIVVPSKIYENSPSVIYEAFSLGVPVITVDLGGAAELVQEGVNGFVYAPGELRAALERALHAQDYDQLSKNAKVAVEKLTLESYVEKLISLVRQK